MGHQAAENRGPAERAERGPARTGKPPEAGGGPEGLEPRVVRLEVGLDELKSQFERSDERWEKWRSEDQQRHMEQRKEFADFKQEVAAGFRDVAANFRRIDDKFDSVGKEMAASARRVDEKFAVMKESIDQIDQKFIRRLELAVAVLLAAVLGTGIFG